MKNYIVIYTDDTNLTGMPDASRWNVVDVFNLGDGRIEYHVEVEDEYADKAEAAWESYDGCESYEEVGEF